MGEAGIAVAPLGDGEAVGMIVGEGEPKSAWTGADGDTTRGAPGWVREPSPAGEAEALDAGSGPAHATPASTAVSDAAIQERRRTGRDYDQAGSRIRARVM